MIKLAGLFVLIVGLVLWVLLASSLLDSLRGGQHASILATVTATATPAAAEPTSTATSAPTPTPTPTPTPLPTTTATAVAEQTYQVAPGDNLTKIARAFGVTIEALQEANHITDPSTLRAGQVLVIPAP